MTTVTVFHENAPGDYPLSRSTPRYDFAWAAKSYVTREVTREVGNGRRYGAASGGICQSMGSRPTATSASFARENGRDPKKPLCALNGDGCADSMIR